MNNNMILVPGGSGGVGCDAGNRLPKSKWPPFSTTVRASLTSLASSAEVPFTAERDVLFSDSSIEIYDAAGNRRSGRFSLNYCNIDLAVNTDISEYRSCCQRKPIFLVGVRENKTLRLEVSADDAIPEGQVWTVEVTYSGVQGNGCCA